MLDLVLDKGIVIDAYVRLAVLGIELLTIDARVVVASVDTYLRFAEAVNRLDLQPSGQTSVPQLMKEGVGKAVEGTARHVARRKTQGLAEKAEPIIQKAAPIIQRAEPIVEKAEEVVERVADALSPEEHRRR